MTSRIENACVGISANHQRSIRCVFDYQLAWQWLLKSHSIATIGWHVQFQQGIRQLDECDSVNV